MCKDCGCGQPGPTQIDGQPAHQVVSPLVPGAGEVAHDDEHDHGHDHGHEHDHAHDHSHPHDHTHPPEELPPPGSTHSHPHRHVHRHPHQHSHGDMDAHDHVHAVDDLHAHATEARKLELNRPVLDANDRQAERNRGFFNALGILTLNVMSSPGSGKTELLRQTLLRIQGRLRAAVIVGDLATDRDAQRLRESGAPIVQITTGTLCHLDAEMIGRALGRLNVRTLDLLFIENVGNLVCPAAFDLGEAMRVALLSVTEGEDKPLKYPPLFHGAAAVVVTKTDLATATGFDRETALANLRRASPAARVFELSARTGQGLDPWCDYLVDMHQAGRKG